MMPKSWTIALLGVFCVVQAASADDAAQAIQPVAPELGRAVDFNLDVIPIFQAKCLACHNKTTAEADLVLERFDAVTDHVEAGNPDDSYLYRVVARAEEPHMPPLPNKVAAKAVTPEELGILRKWIEEGAKPGMAAPAGSALNWQPVPPSVQSVFSLAISPTNRFMAAGRANHLVVYDLTSQSQVAELTDPALLAVQQDGVPLYGAGAAHLDFVHALSFSDDGNLLASAGYRVVKLWERQRDTQLQKLAAEGAITAAATSADGALAATAAAGKVLVWNLASGQAVATLDGFEKGVAALAFAPDGAQLAAGGEDQLLRVWTIADGTVVREIATPAPIRAAVFDKEGARLISGHGDNIIRVWSLAVAESTEAEATEGTETPEQPPAPALEIKGHGNPVTCLALVPNADQLVSGSEDGTARVWNLADGAQVRAMNLGSAVWSISVSSDGSLFAAGGEGKIARVWNAQGQQQAEIKGSPSHDRQVVLLTDEQTVAKARQGLADAAQKEAEKDVQSREESLKKANEQKEASDKALAEAEEKVKPLAEAAAAAAKELEASPDDEALKKKKADADAALQKEEEARDKARDAVTSAERAVTLSQEALEGSKARHEQSKLDHEAATKYAEEVDGQLNAAKEAAGQAPQPIRAVALSADAKQLLTAGHDGEIHLWDAATGKHLDTLHGHAGPVRHLTALDGGSVFSASDDQSAVVWETTPRWKLIARLGASADSPLDVSQSPIADRALALDFSPDGTLLATGGGEPSRSGELLLWDVATGTVKHTFEDAHSDTVFDVEFSWDGKQLVTGAADKFVKVFNVETGEFVRAFEGHTNHVLGVSWKADGSALASGGADNAIKLWNANTGEQIRTISGFNKQVTDVDYVGVQDLVATCSGDAKVATYRSNGSALRNYAGFGDFVYRVAPSRDGSIIAAAGEDGIIRVWNLNDGKLLSEFAPPPVEAPETASVN